MQQYKKKKYYEREGVIEMHPTIDPACLAASTTLITLDTFQCLQGPFLAFREISGQM